MSTLVRAGQLDHVGIAVRNLLESVTFYQQALGFQAPEIEWIEGESVTIAGLGNRSEPWVELLESSDEGSAVGRFVRKHGPGLHHLALRVDNLEDAVRQITAENGRVLDEPKIGAGGCRYVFIHPGSTGGVLIELVERHGAEKE